MLCRSSTMASIFRTKKSPSNQTLPYTMLKTRFPFLYWSLDTKTSTIASNRNFKSCLSICCLAPQHIFRLLHVCRGLFFALALAPYCVALLNAPPSDRESWSIVIDARRCSCPIVCGFRRRDDLLAWGDIVCEPLWAKNLEFDFRRNTTNLSEIIGYIDLSDFRQISPKHSRNNGKGCVGKSWYLKYLSCGVYLRKTPHIFLVTPTLWMMIMSKSTLRVTTRDHEWLWPRVTKNDHE